MKKTLALLLTFVMLFSAFALTSCGNKKPEDLILGKWEGTIKGEVFAEEIEKEVEEMSDYLDFKDLPDVKVYLEFDDGEVTQTVDEESAEEFLDAVLDVIRDGMKDLLTDTVNAQTGQKLTFEEILKSLGQTEDELWESMLSEIDLDEVKKEMFEEVVQEYEFDEEELLIDKEETFYELTEKELVIKVLDTKVTFKKAK